jgi:peptidoglycan/xylan/chitin deacetylase (PgdA/CDA1 family)
MKKLTKITIPYILVAILSIVFTQQINNTYASSIKEIHVENEKAIEKKRTNPIPFSVNSSLLSPTTSITTAAVTTSGVTSISATDSLGPNLIQNPGIESSDSSGNPIGWAKGGYGVNSRTLNYPVLGNNGTKGLSIKISTYSSGDAKWFFNEVTVTPGKKYRFSDFSKANTPSILTVRYKMADGTFVYKDLANIPPSTSYTQNTVDIIIPTNAISLTIFHLINTVGELDTDDYSLNLVNTATESNNLVPNGNFEIVGSNSSPENWLKGGWGTNTRTFTYPATGVGGSNAAKVTISSYINGDAKWYFNPISIPVGTYTYSDVYTSDVPSIITIQYRNSDGSITYKDLAQLPPNSSLTNASVDFAVTSGVQSITIFHLIKNIGSLTLDNVSVVKKSAPSGVFSTGAVTLRFDDGWLSQYETAVPKLNSVGIKGTFYIVSQQIADLGFPGFMSIAQIKNLYTMGHEIGGHTRTHPFLTSLSPTEQQNEIAGGRSDILSWNVGPIKSFAYPFGDYDSTTISIVQNAGFTSGLSTLDGYVKPTSDRLQLERQGPLVSTPISEIKQWIDTAQANKEWLIITLHAIDNSGTDYSMTPSTFTAMVDYIVSKKIPVVTVTQGLESLQ